MPDPITGLVGDLHRLVLEVEKSQKQRNEEEKDKTEGRPLEGQIRTLAPDTILASTLRNAIVYSPDETRIGDVNDLIIKADGKVEGVVVGIDCGEKSVALKWERFKVEPEPDGCARVMLSATKEELQDAPGFTVSQEQERKSAS